MRCVKRTNYKGASARSTKGFQPTHPVHRFTLTVNERVYSKMLSKGVCPTQSVGPRALLLPKQRKQGSRGQSYSLGCQQPEVANRVWISVRYVLSQSGNKLLRGKPDFDGSFLF